MGGRPWFLGHAYSSYTCTGSTLDIMDYGLAEAIGVSGELTARILLILPISTPRSKLRRFSRRNTSKLHKHASYNIYHIHKCFYAFTCSNYIVQKLQMISAKQIIVLRHRRTSHRTGLYRLPTSSLCPPPHPPAIGSPSRSTLR